MNQKMYLITTNIVGKAHDFNRGGIAFLIANMYKL